VLDAQLLALTIVKDATLRALTTPVWFGPGVSARMQQESPSEMRCQTMAELLVRDVERRLSPD